MNAVTIIGLPREELLRRFLSKEAGNDGAFVVGVLTTGIYCLPSCVARQPKPENLRFFADEDAARATGLRACKRCKPDRFYQRFDPDGELVVDLAQEVRRNPIRFIDVGAMISAAGVGKTKLTELFRRYFHTSPADHLMAARIAHAAEHLSRGGAKVIDAGLAAGFESSSPFHQHFRRSMGLSPGAYRKFCIGTDDGFSLTLPEDFRFQDLFVMFGRDASAVCERVEGARGIKALLLDDSPVRLEFSFRSKSVDIRLKGPRRITGHTRLEAHSSARRMLNFASDPGAFEKRIARMAGMGRLVRGRRGLRIPQTSDFFEGLTWVIVGQQVNLSFASSCRSALIQLAGRDAGDGFRAHPDPQAVSELMVEDLKALKFSGRKAEYLIDAARKIISGELDSDVLVLLPADQLDERLLAIRGLGPWSTQYLAMRSFGFGDCVPVGDAGLIAALQRFFNLEERPDVNETLRCMEPFAPHRSLATYHLWKTLAKQA